MKKELKVIGWREWISLPDIGIGGITAKIDTGAKTSALHAYDITTFKKGKSLYTRFKIHPLAKSNEVIINCVAKVIDERVVSDSGGHKEKRLVIKTNLKIGEYLYPIEVTLTDRKMMNYRMLIGRQALKGKFLVNAGRSYRLGQLEEHLKFIKTISSRLN